MESLEYLTLPEVAELIRTPVGTIYQWRSRSPKQGPPAMKLGRRLVFARSDVDSWMAAQVESAA